MRILGASQFDQCVLNLALIHLCNSAGHVGEESRKLSEQQSEDAVNPWLEPCWITIFVPHPDQQYEGISLEAGLSRGYNVELNPLLNRDQVPYFLPKGSHFVTVLKQKGLDDEFELAATGIFVQTLAVLSLDIIVDAIQNEYQSVAIKHPIIRDYPSDWERKLRMYLNQEISYESLPALVGYVDQAVNSDYRPPDWNQVRLTARGFAGV